MKGLKSKENKNWAHSCKYSEPVMPQLPLKRQTGWLKSLKLCTDALVIGSMSPGIHNNVLPIKSCKYMNQFFITTYKSNFNDCLFKPKFMW